MPTRCNRGFLLQILLLAQHVSGTSMPIIRSSGVLYSGCCLWCFVLQFSSCWSGVELSVQFAGCCSILQTRHITLSSAPDCVLRFSSCWSGMELSVRFAGCCSILQTGHITLNSAPDQQLENRSTKHHRQQPLYNTPEPLMMGIVVPETC